MPGRHAKSDAYRYGFNGMEKDDEVKGSGNAYTSKFRAYDARIGRWFSVDPEMRSLPYHSPYIAYADNPIIFIDKYGNKFEPVEGLTERQKIKVAFMLEVLEQALPEIYKKMEESKIVFRLGVGKVPQDNVPKNMVRVGITYTRLPLKENNVKDVDGDPLTRDYVTNGSLYGHEFGGEWGKKVKLYEDFKSEEDPSLTDVKITEEQAAILLDFRGEVSTKVEDYGIEEMNAMVITGGHELGHQFFHLEHPAWDFFTSDFGTSGHVSNNPETEIHPSGKEAFKFEKALMEFVKTKEYKKIRKKYKKKLKELDKKEKTESKKKKSN